MIQLNLTYEQVELIVSGLRCLDAEFGLDQKEENFFSRLKEILDELEQ